MSDLEAAYRDTDYRVLDAPGGPFTIRVGEFSFEAEHLMYENCVFEWAFVTACNPGSDQLAPEENARRIAELEAVCLYHGWPHYFGEGAGRDGSWPPEPSYFVVGISESEAVAVAEHFGQNAIVVGRAGEQARLVWVKR
jgi:hypothetical protein